jgi:adenylate cyclase, class 2
MSKEIEIKFRVPALRALNRKLHAAGFRLVTRRTHEMNTLYDLPGEILRRRHELLRIRKYGSSWTLTFKHGTRRAKHSSRFEIETTVTDGKKLDAILRLLGYAPTFRYEKFRAQWADKNSVDKKENHGKGVIVVDETPVGNFCEIEGPPRWIDATAKALGVTPADYITKNYATLFLEWKQKTGNNTPEMTFQSIQK